MKKIIALIFLISSLTYSQSWNTVKTTNINVSDAARVEMLHDAGMKFSLESNAFARLKPDHFWE